jgi:hypothetical protein
MCKLKCYQLLRDLKKILLAMLFTAETQRAQRYRREKRRKDESRREKERRIEGPPSIHLFSPLFSPLLSVLPLCSLRLHGEGA